MDYNHLQVTDLDLVLRQFAFDEDHQYNGRIVSDTASRILWFCIE